ncbi:MAG: tRNA lysidine(34) synthetase TilS [Chloroflexi bacterium]|nr:tRNA lysidine(34) synthetase TilS [Chloroflexota bacterium]
MVGVSGGADSTCLLDCLHRLGLPLVVAHFDHGLRMDSWSDARKVLRLAAKLRLPAIAARSHWMKAQGGSLENAARIARYRFLGDCARTSGSRVLAVGHTQDDQAETVLLHLLRGAGTGGLRGMRPETTLDRITGEKGDAGIRVVRPLLGVPRAATEAWCREQRLPTLHDPSNDDPAILRNRIRAELVPLMGTYNPSIRLALARMADVLSAEADAVEAVAEAFAPAVVRALGDGRLGVEPGEMAALPLGMQRIIVRWILTRLAAERGEVGFEGVERARRAVGRTARTSLPGGLEVSSESGLRVFGAAGFARSFAEFPQFLSRQTVPFQAPQRLALDAGWSIEVGHEERPGDPGQATDPADVIRLDADALGEDFELSAARRGERMTPFAGSGSKTVRDLLQQARIPAPAREAWPVIRQRGAIVWLVGIRRAEVARISKQTRRVLRMRLEAPEPA